MKFPKEIKDKIERSGAIGAKIDIPACAMPPMKEVEAVFINQRDELARLTGEEPENIRMIGVEIFYLLGTDEGYTGIAKRVNYDPKYANLVMEGE
jgi:hypothetical protein